MAERELFQLVKSLTKGEKGEFTKWARRHRIGKENNYYILYRAIQEQTDYDPEALAQALQDQPFFSHIGAERKNLREQILKCMQLYHAARDIDAQLQGLLQDHAFLESRGIHQFSQKRLRKAKKIAMKYGKYLVLLEIIQREKRWIIARAKKGMEAELAEKIREYNAALNNLEVEFKFVSLYQKLFVLVRQEGFTRDNLIRQRVESLVRELQQSKQQAQATFLSQSFYLQAMRNYYRILGHREESYTFSRAIVDLWEDPDHAHQRAENPIRYKIAISNFLNACHDNDRYEEFPEKLEMLRRIPCRNFDEEAERFQNIAYLDYLYRINTGQYDAAREMEPEILAGMERYGEKISDARKLSLAYNVMIFNFRAADYANTRRWIDRILDMKGGEHRKDIQLAIRVLLPIIQFELGLEDILPWTTRSGYRFLHARGRLYEFESLSLTMINKVSGEPVGEARAKVLLIWEQKLLKLQEAMTGIRPLGMDDVRSWIRHKIDGSPML